MKRALGTFITTGIGLALMIYSASRTLNLLQMTLPIGQKDLAWLALAAFDGGLLGWTLYFMHNAKGGPQRAISLLMIVVCLIGALIGFGADTLIGAESGGLINQIDKNFAFSALIATIAIVALNIAAVIGVHVLSPENMHSMTNEEFDETIEHEANKKSKSEISKLAADLSVLLTDAKMNELRLRHTAKAKQLSSGTVEESTSTDNVIESLQKALGIKSSNGKVDRKELATLNSEGDARGKLKND